MLLLLLLCNELTLDHQKSPTFALRIMLDQQPLRFLLAVFLLMLFIMTYLVRVAEFTGPPLDDSSTPFLCVSHAIMTLLVYCSHTVSTIDTFGMLRGWLL